jgi:copper homeostasis protein
MKDYQFEVCANSVESCIAAQAGGADRVELCAGIPEGGTTPSYGDILIAREALQQTKLHIIVRPRGGDFLYSSTEQRIMLKDIENARRLGADGVVFGCLTAEGNVDIPLMEQLMEASQGMSTSPSAVKQPNTTQSAPRRRAFSMSFSMMRCSVEE